MHKLPVFDYLLVKVAARCNINCSYCYWFRDDDVYRLPKTMSTKVARQLLQRIKEQINSHQLERFSVLLHGGEPLLWGKERFLFFVQECRKIQLEQKIDFSISTTTNGMLIDQEWCEIFKTYEVSVTISLDGPEELHDRNRVTFKNEGTYSEVVKAIELMRENNLPFGILAVADVNEDPDVVAEHFVSTLGIKHFDILIPDATHDDKPPSIKTFYSRLFDLWLDKYGKSGIGMRLPKGIATGLLGGDAKLESIGYGPIQTCAVMPDGSLEPLDVLRISGNGTTKTALNIFDNDLQSVTKNNVWLAAFNASLDLPEKCNQCQYQSACGGGYLPHRFSKDRGYDNPSVYCDDLIGIFDHAQKRIEAEIFVSVPGKLEPVMISNLHTMQLHESAAKTSEA